jgi:hypothetical protein
MAKILFILKKKEGLESDDLYSKAQATGLFNSANYMHEMLVAAGIDSAIDIAIDNNCIDRLVAEHRPTYVIIEALWVVPSKFDILQKLHPSVTWIIRLHSETPFLANEGIAMDWIGDYSDYQNIIIAANAPRALEEVRSYLQIRNGWDRGTSCNKVVYLPNFYPMEFNEKPFLYSDTVNIGCFGAIRPLKNHLVQAIASLKFAHKLGKKLRFHINASRIEMQGSPVLHNIKGLFEQLDGTGHELIGHPWMPKNEFKQMIASDIDIGIQVSFSETFNIVAADLLSQGVPVLGSKEIPWLHGWFSADPTECDSIVLGLTKTYTNPYLNVIEHRRNLNKYCDKTRDIWVDYFGEINESSSS